MAQASTSTSPTPMETMETTETVATPNEGGESTMTSEQWKAISNIFDTIFGYREPE